MSNVRVFLSYDVDHDVDLCDQLSEQSNRGGWGFQLIARSSPGEVSDAWRETTRRHIRGVDHVVVMCGEHTAARSSANEELQIAEEEEKPCLFLWGRREQMCTMPSAAKRGHSMYQWTRAVLLEQLSPKLRNAQALRTRKQS